MRTLSGRRIRIRPCDLTADLATDPVVDIDWPRPDLRMGQIEFLIGLLATLAAPAGERAWRRWWQSPPDPEALAALFAPADAAFSLSGPGPRFLQDQAELGQEDVPAGALFIDQCGAATISNNTDLFVKRGQIRVLGARTAAIALFSLQAFSPAGGAGHRTSLRGGGPLTSLALAPDAPALWHFLWLNVPPVAVDDQGRTAAECLAAGDGARVFPWLGPTRISDKTGRATGPEDMHPDQAFWGMPRRIRLLVEDNPEGHPCDITGAVEPQIVRAYRTRPWGVNYVGVRHPLTPHYRLKKDAPELLPVHPQPGGLTYRHWPSLVRPGDTREPARAVLTAEQRLADLADRPGVHARLLAAGYDMDNMKARGFLETEQPLLFASDVAEADGPRQAAFQRLVDRLVTGASETASLAIHAARKALGTDAGSGLDLARERFFVDTEAAFFARVSDGLAAIEQDPDADLQALAGGWLEGVLKPAAFALFDAQVPAEALTANGDLKAITRAVAERRLLGIALSGHGPVGQKLFTALGLGTPEKRARAPRRAKAGS